MLNVNKHHWTTKFRSKMIEDQEDIEVNFSTELSPSFLITCIDKVIKLKNPLFKKTSYDEEPKDILIEVNSNGVKELKTRNGIISIIVPIDITIIKSMNFFGSSFEKKIEFSIDFEHYFSIELTDNGRVNIISKETKFSWIKIPNIKILSIEFNITNYIEPKLNEHLKSIIEGTYKVLSKSLEDQIEDKLKRISNSFKEPKIINGNKIYLYFIEINFEKNFICNEESDRLKIYGSILIGLSKEEIKNEFKFKIKNIEKPKNIKALNLIRLGILNEMNHPFTLKLYLKIPLQNIINNIFYIGSNIVNVKEGLVSMKAKLNSEIVFLKNKISSNDISFDVNVPLHLHVIKLGVERFCEINVKFSFSIIFSEMGIELTNCKGIFEWIEKPNDFSPFGFKIIDVEKEIEDELKIKILKSQELISNSIQRAFHFIETDSNGSFLFPKFLNSKNVLMNLSVGNTGNGRIGLLIERDNSRYFSLSIVQNDQNNDGDTKNNNMNLVQM
eukprot:gene6055-10056_t